MTTDQQSTTEEFRTLAEAAAPCLPLPALTPAGYAAAHALFESRSDQRRRLTEWLVALVTSPPTVGKVLSIGCGDGSVDVEVAGALAARGPVSYRGIEPHAASATRFLERLAGLDGVAVSVDVTPFDRVPPAAAGYDLVLAVHSLYYVPDLPSALAAAHRLLAPGGRLVVVHAPRERLNSLVGVLAPGRVQEFSDAVSRAIDAQGWPARTERIDATLDLGRRGPADDPEWRRVIDFTVQAEIPDGLIGPVERALQAAGSRAPSGGGLLLPHPVDAFVIS